MANVGTSREGTPSRNGNASIDKESPVTSMRRKLNNLWHLSTECCIYEVPKKLLKINEDAYTPLRVSIGPLHHGKKDLQPMEEHKWRYLQDFLQHSQKSLEELVKFMEEKEVRIRQSYAETINLESGKFVEIILVDAAFVVEVLLRYRFPELKPPNDRIFRKPWMIEDINLDLLLLENQLPIFVLQDLFEMTRFFNQNETLSHPFILLTLRWFRVSNKIRDLSVLGEINISEVKHFLDLLRSCLIPRGSPEQTERTLEFISSATELHEAGVKFEVGSSGNLFDIKFRGNVLEIPHIKIYDMTERLLRNLIAFEQCHYNVRFISDYAVLMDDLISTSKDVELLVQAKVVENWLGDYKEVSNLFNRLTKNIILDTNTFHFAKLYGEVNDYCKIRRHKWRATLRHDYCSTPWRVLSIFAAVILLVLTFIQSLCSLVPVNKW